MIKVAIVEDDPNARDALLGHLKHYTAQKRVPFDVDNFPDGISFLNQTEFNKTNYDILFLDIELPGLSGIEVAKRFREFDEYAVLIFTTIMRQYAISGYLVNAMDYMVKPIEYLNLSLKIDKAIALMDRRVGLISLSIVGGDVVRFLAKDVYFIENYNHLCTFHTAKGDYKQYNSMNNVEKEYAKYGFLRCSSSYIVNPVNIEKISDETILIGGKTLSISHGRKKKFMSEVFKYI